MYGLSAYAHFAVSLLCYRGRTNPDEFALRCLSFRYLQLEAAFLGTVSSDLLGYMVIHVHAQTPERYEQVSNMWLNYYDNST